MTDPSILFRSRYGNNTIGRVKTDSNGRYIATSPVYPNVPLKVDLIYSTNVSKPTNTDGNGNSVGFIPIPPPFVNITSFFDKDSNKLYSSGELRAPNITVLIKFANGTVWKTVSTGSKGDLFFNYRHRMPNMPLIIETSDGKFKKQVVMDAAGNLIELVPIPPPKTTVVRDRAIGTLSG